jgi:hypothetical protein
MLDEKCTPGMLASNLLGDGPQISNAVLIYRTEDDKLHWFRIGAREWAVGAMTLCKAEQIQNYLDTPSEV